MRAISISQKQKITLFLVLLTIGFMLLGVFTSTRLSEMERQYFSSNQITTGSITMYQTEVRLLSLAKELGSVTGDQVAHLKQEVAAVSQEVQQNATFLEKLNLSEEASALVESTKQFELALLPWLELRTELGFTVSEGKLGQLKSLADTIEKKIAETGMVTLNSDFQAMVKAQQNYLLEPSEQNLKLFNRAMFSFVSISNSYAMLELYEKEIELFKQTFTRVSELSQQLGSMEGKLVASKIR